MSDLFNAIGALPVAYLPPGAGYWAAMFGLQALIGGILAGITVALTLKLALLFGGSLTSLFRRMI